MVPSLALFEDILLDACPAAERAVLDAEVDMLITRFARDPTAEALASMACALEHRAERCENGRPRLKLWAAVLRCRARNLRPNESSAGSG